MHANKQYTCLPHNSSCVRKYLHDLSQDEYVVDSSDFLL
jgi:hypothetical protein